MLLIILCWLLYGLDQMLHTYTYMKTLFENYSKSVSYCDSCISLSHAAHLNPQFLLFRKVWAVYARTLALSLSIFFISTIWQVW